MGRRDSDFRENVDPHTLPRYGDGVAEFVRRVVDTCQPLCIILHGSFARGDWHERSDVDIIVVSEHLQGDFFARQRALREIRIADAPIEPLGYRPELFEEMLERGAVHVLDAFEFGFPLHGADYFHKLHRRFLLMKEHGVAREEICWRIPDEALEVAIQERLAGR